MAVASNMHEATILYAEFKMLPKRGALTVSVSMAQEVVLEAPRKLIKDWKRENPNKS
jgi:hypothetical protein